MTCQLLPPGTTQVGVHTLLLSCTGKTRAEHRLNDLQGASCRCCCCCCCCQARVNVPDERFTWLCDVFTSPRVPYLPSLDICDIAGLVK